jgi:hypothetical protein
VYPRIEPARLAALLLPWTLAVQAQAGNLTVAGAWSRPTPPGATVAAVYFSVANTGTKADRLLALSTPIAGKVELHESRTVRGVNEMHAVAALDCPPGASVAARPNGVHAMLFGLTKPLIAGTTFSLSLQFRDAGTLSVPVAVRADEAVAR